VEVSKMTIRTGNGSEQGSKNGRLRSLSTRSCVEGQLNMIEPRSGSTATTRLQLADWRRRVSELYAAVRAEGDPRQAHALWRRGRDELFRSHPQSPLPARDPLRATGLPYWPYDPAMRYELALLPPTTTDPRALSAGEDGTVTVVPIGRLELPAPFNASVDVWWLQQYGGGVFLPLRDGSAGQTSYSGGRYALDTVKGSDLGGTAHSVVVDLNFLYHPSCRYNPAWVCPLAPTGNRISQPVLAGERLP
jgi:uncharacterized protein (DUF1684 family)